MEPACIRHSDLPGTSKLFADFSYHFDRVSQFYRFDPHDGASFAAAAGAIEYPEARREAMTRVLRAQNGPSKLLDLFSQPGTVAVVTGQQVGLFSGPAYTIYKALTAARVAETLRGQGIPAVPVFWLATEDHDFEEVNHAWTFDRARQPVRLEVKEANARPRPVGGIAVDRPPIDELARSLEGFPHADEVLAAVAQSYRPGVAMGAAFRTLLAKLLAKFGILFFDPLDAEARKIAEPIVVKALESAPVLKKRLIARGKELESAGYHAQVLVDGKTSLFFLLDNGERTPLRRKDSEFSQFCDRASEISPNALLRPVMQDYMLPTVSYIGGPAELAYLAQSEVIYEELLGRMPVVMSRCGFTLLESRAAKLLSRYRISVAETFVNPESLKERIASALVPESVEHAFTEAAAGVKRNLESLDRELQRFDPTLAAALDKSRAKILFQLNKTQSKVARETLRRDSKAGADADYLAGLLYPHRHLQERFYSILPFLAEHGLDLIDRLYDAVRLDCPDHRVLST